MGLGAGQIVYADDLAGLRPGLYYKGGSTTRNNTATLTDDPDLSNVHLDPGFYSIKVMFLATNANAAAKLKTRWAFTGTWTAPLRMVDGPGSTNTSTDPYNVTPISMRSVPADSQDALYSFGVSAASVRMEEVADRVEILTAGNFSLQWAQNAATVANTILQPGGYIRVMQVEDL